MPSDATRNPPPNETADANIAFRGPTRSNHAPNVAADRPRNTIATLKTQPMVLSFQSPGADWVPPMSRDSGKFARQSREREGLRNLVAEQACGRVDRACHEGADRVEVAPHEGVACCRNDRLALDEKMLESLAQLAWREAARGGALERRCQ